MPPSAPWSKFSERMFIQRRRLRIRLGLAKLSQEQVGVMLTDKMRELGIPIDRTLAQSTIGDYENGVSTPTVPKMLGLCALFEVSADYLMGRVDEPSSTIPIPPNGYSPPPESYLVDVTEYEKARGGTKWSADIPPRALIVNKTRWEEMVEALEERINPKRKPRKKEQQG